MFIKPLFILALLGASFSIMAASPNINIGAMHEYIFENKTNILKRVRNSGDATAFVRISISEMVFTGNSNKPQEIPVTTNYSEGLASDAMLVASPARLIIPAHAQQSTRLLYRGPRDKERYFRVRFSPATPDKMDEFALTNEQSESYKKTISAGVNILTGYGMVVIVKPDNLLYNTQLNDSATKYTVRNQGNSIIILEKFTICEIKNEKQCSSGRKIHVRPGMSEEIIKEKGSTYRFDLVEGNHKKKIRFG